MSVMIKDMEMPTNCTRCPCSDDDAQFCKAADEYIPMPGKPKFCPLAEVEPQRIKGRWVRKESDLSWWYECSECGESPLFDPYENEVRTPFCPWCGARMEEEEDG